MKVFLTGATGFLGAYILQSLLDNGHEVYALRRGNKIPAFLPAHIFDRVHWVEGDILDIVLLEQQLQGMDAVVHSAAKVSFDPNDRTELFRVNVEGTANIVNAALATSVKRLVYISSVAALGRTANAETVTEQKEWEDHPGNSNYAVSKHMAEMEVWRAMGEGLDGVILNPSTILGYGDWNQTSCAIFKNIYEGFPWYSEGVNGFVAVSDVANAAVLLLESGISQQRFIVNGENRTFRQVFDAIADNFNKKRPWRNATPLLAALAWRLEKVKTLLTGKPSMITKESARIAQTTTYFSNDKIRSALPQWQFMPLSECIRDACNHYLQRL